MQSTLPLPHTLGPSTQVIHHLKEMDHLVPAEPASALRRACLLAPPVAPRRTTKPFLEVHAPFRRQRGRKARVQITDVRVQSLWHPSHQIGRKRPAMPWHGGKGRIAISTGVVLSPPMYQVEISAFCSQFIPHRPQLPAKRLEVIVHHAGLVILADYEL